MPFIYGIMLFDAFVSGSAAFAISGNLGFRNETVAPILAFLALYLYSVLAVVYSLFGGEKKYDLIHAYSKVRRIIGLIISVFLAIPLVLIPIFDSFQNVFWILSLVGIVFENTLNAYWSHHFMIGMEHQKSSHHTKVVITDYANSDQIV